MAIDPVILGIAFSAGVATFFSPCSVALVPAYFAYFVGLDEQEGSSDDVFQAASSGAVFGGSAAAGILGVALVAGVAVNVFTGWMGVSTQLLGDAVAWLALLVAVLVLGLGVLMILHRGPSLSVDLPVPERKTMVGMAGFGAVFALGSMGCTLPVFLFILSQAFLLGPVGGLATFLVYGAGLAALMLVVGVGLAVAKEQVEEHIRQVKAYVKPVSGAILIGAGAYLLYFYVWVVPPWL